MGSDSQERQGREVLEVQGTMGTQRFSGQTEGLSTDGLTDGNKAGFPPNLPVRRQQQHRSHAR